MTKNARKKTILIFEEMNDKMIDYFKIVFPYVVDAIFEMVWFQSNRYPPISEHCPNNIPGLFIFIWICFNWFRMQFIFTLTDWIVQECITSKDEVIIIIWVFNGTSGCQFQWGWSNGGLRHKHDKHLFVSVHQFLN